MKEAIRYLNNAKEILKKVPVEDDTYTDVKPVREAMGTAYLAVLEAINEYLLEKKGFLKKELPLSICGFYVVIPVKTGIQQKIRIWIPHQVRNDRYEEYRVVLKKYLPLTDHNGKILREFEMLYDALHIAGYYRGLIYNTDAVKGYLKAARTFIEKIG
jgi:hypothetical protein